MGNCRTFYVCRAKHIDVRIHFIRDFVAETVLDVIYVPSEENDADMLGKPLGPSALNRINGRLGREGPIEEEC